MVYNTGLFLTCVTCQLWVGDASVLCHPFVGIQPNGVASIWDITDLVIEGKENMAKHVLALSVC